MVPTRSDDATEIQGIAPAVRHALRVVGIWSGGHCMRDVPPEGAIVIGRSEDVDLVIDHPSVSRRHATLRVKPGSPIRIEDHGSANGTFVDGTKLEPHASTAVASGTVIEVGAAMVVLRGSVPPLDR